MSNTGEDTASSFWARRSAGLLVVLFVVALFIPTLWFGRLGFDDHWLWSDESPLRAPSLATWHDVFFQLDARARHDLGTEYLPVRDLVVAADMAIWADVDRGPHRTQLVLYALTVLALGSLLVQFGMRRELAWTATLIWAIHPVHVQTVAWLSERKGVLAGLFVLACGHAWVRYRRGGRKVWLVLAALAAVAAVWSKAPAMFAPAVFALWDRWLLPPARRRWIAVAAIGGAAALAAVPVVMVARDARVIELAQDSGSGRLVRAVGAQGHYVQSLVMAHRPSISYPIQTEGSSPRDLAIGALAVLGSVGLVVWARRDPARRAGWLYAMLAWAWVWFVPIGHILAPVHILVADRFVYLWSLAGCVGVAWLIGRATGWMRMALVGLVVCGLSIATVRALEPWTSTGALFANAFASNPRDPTACENHASVLYAGGHVPEALDVLDTGLRAEPRHPYLLSVKARFLTAIGRHDEALAASAVAAESGHASAMWVHADLLRGAGKIDEALNWARRAARRRPETPLYARTEAQLLLSLGRSAEAEVVLRLLLLHDAMPLHHLLLAKALIAQGRADEALPHLDIAGRQRSLAAEAAALRGSSGSGPP